MTQQDGKILVGGNFQSYNGELTKFITRLNVDGSEDTSFNTGLGPDNRIKTISVLPNDRIIIGGEFFNYDGQAVEGIARLNADGTLDTNFNMFGTGFSGIGIVNTTAVQSDGKIVIGGLFNTYNGVNTNRIARLNSDGSLDSSFTIGTGANNTVLAIALQQNGKIIVGGAFTLFNGVSSNKIVRLNENGSIDTSFSTGIGFDFQVFSIQIQDDGKIIVGGTFSSYNGTNAKRIIRLNPDGSIDTSFNVGEGANISVNTISIQNDGKIILGGNFNTFQ
ncbi:MAG: delta-60 repeat domain-containing protein [Flavobacterium sp.]|nr:delta-60 repeat domain-containing protein [Flavobacterium sp.]